MCVTPSASTIPFKISSEPPELNDPHSSGSAFLRVLRVRSRLLAGSAGSVSTELFLGVEAPALGVGALAFLLTGSTEPALGVADLTALLTGSIEAVGVDDLTTLLDGSGAARARLSFLSAVFKAGPAFSAPEETLQGLLGAAAGTLEAFRAAKGARSGARRLVALGLPAEAGRMGC